ncbi:hypothetical protein [Collinsella tanakaei]|uniref:hypothetical protein n=1 Tax=Collinsella tanakaei TaxID=626935 RepID=UPI00195E9BDB|nr:hypothetical protein [Collinsella tanakaei]MBM6868767.1 hypothetical protein [Collinsella tanakaei]
MTNRGRGIGYTLATTFKGIAISACMLAAMLVGCASPSGTDAAKGVSAPQGSAEVSADPAASGEDEKDSDGSKLTPGINVIRHSAYLRALPQGVLAGAHADATTSDDMIACDPRFAEALAEGGISTGDIASACGASSFAEALDADPLGTTEAIRQLLERAGYEDNFSKGTPVFGESQGVTFTISFDGGGLGAIAYAHSEDFDQAFKLTVGLDAYRGTFEYVTDVLPTAAALRDIVPQAFAEYGADTW